MTGQPTRAIEVAERQIVIRRRLGDPARLGAALNNLGNFLCDTGMFDQAEPVLDEAIDHFREVGMPLTLPLSTLGHGRAHKGQYDEAALNLLAAVRAAEAEGGMHGHAVALGGLGGVLAMSDRGEEARPHLIEARERFEELRVVPGVVDADIWLGVVERAAGHTEAARDRFRSAMALRDEHSYAEAIYWLAQLTASVIDDQATATILVGAAGAAYVRLDIEQGAFITDDLASTRTALAAALDQDEFARHLRACARRSQNEVADLAISALLASPAVAPPAGTNAADA